MRAKTALTLVGIALSIGVTEARAQTATRLTDLITNNQTLTDRDKVFENFFCSTTTDLCDFIFVSTLGSIGSDSIGLQFVFNPAINDSTPGSSGDATIFYSVFSNAGPIIAISLAADGDVTGTGTFEVTESVQDFANPSFPLVGRGVITQNDNPPATIVDLAGQFQSLFIEKDFGYSVGTNGSVSVVTITQDFIQVPVPAAAALFALGLAGLAAARGRRG